ncbi:MAG: hypothetical protein ACFCD0_24210 [Gemmataceae bacterium]
MVVFPDEILRFLGATNDVSLTDQATGVFFSNEDTLDGLLLVGSNTDSDTFLVPNTTEGNRLTIDGSGGDDFINVTSTFADDSNNVRGNLDAIEGELRILGGEGRDEVYINDRGKVGDFDYLVSPTEVLNAPTSGAPDRPDFAGIFYDGSVDFLRLDGTDQGNTFDVKPSTTTQYITSTGTCLTPKAAKQGLVTICFWTTLGLMRGPVFRKEEPRPLVTQGAVLGPSPPTRVSISKASNASTTSGSPSLPG